MESPESEDVFSESWKNCAFLEPVKKLSDEQTVFPRENSMLSLNSTASNITSSIKKENLHSDLVLCNKGFPIVVKTENDVNVDRLNANSSQEDDYFIEESQNEVKFSPKSYVKTEPSITDSEEEESLSTFKNSECNEKVIKEEYFVESKLIVQEEIDIKAEDEAEVQFTAKSAIGQIKKWHHPSNRRFCLTEPPTFKCLNCTYQTHRKENIARHVLVHTEKTLVCSHCSYKTWDEAYFKRHKLIHAPEEQVKLHQCPECSYRSIRKSDLTQHMIRHKKADDATWYQCPECPHRTKRRSVLTRHLNLIHKKDAPTHKCTLCCYETFRKDDLTKHMRNMHKPEVIQLIHCQEEGCSYKTHHKSDLALHIRMIHKCPSDKKAHELGLEEQNKWFSCTLCQHKATTLNNLKQHMVVHRSNSETKWFHCSECPFKSKYNNSLKLHKLIHNLNTAKIFKCSECSFRTVRAQNFRDHRLVHKVSAWFDCYLCPLRTSRKYCLAKHIRRKHRDNDGQINGDKN